MEQRFQRCNIKFPPKPVILSEVGVREADAHAVEGARVRLGLAGTSQEFWPIHRAHRENTSRRLLRRK